MADHGAHLDPEVRVFKKVLGRGVAHYVPVLRLCQHRLLPENLRHLFKTQGHEKLLRESVHLVNSVVLRNHLVSDIQDFGVVERLHNVLATKFVIMTMMVTLTSMLSQV